MDHYQGPAYRGKGHGARYLVTHGVVGDYCIVVEPSQFRITWAQCGAVFIKITTYGEPMYGPFVDHPVDARESKNAVVRMASIIPALEEWARRYEQEHRYEFGAGTMVPKVNIGSIFGGAPFKPNFSPAICNLYVEAFMTPDQRAIDVLREVRAVLGDTGIEAKSSLFLSVNSYESKGAEPLGGGHGGGPRVRPRPQGGAHPQRLHQHLRGPDGVRRGGHPGHQVWPGAGSRRRQAGYQRDAEGGGPRGRRADVRIRRPGGRRPRPGMRLATAGRLT